MTRRRTTKTKAGRNSSAAKENVQANGKQQKGARARRKDTKGAKEAKDEKDKAKDIANQWILRWKSTPIGMDHILHIFRKAI